MSAGKHTPGRRLSPSQVCVLRAIASNGYRPTAMEGRTIRALMAAGLVIERAGHPPTYGATEAGRAAIAKATGSAA